MEKKIKRKIKNERENKKKLSLPLSALTYLARHGVYITLAVV